MTFYYAQTDENGVLCVDQVGDERTAHTMVSVAGLAESYPEVIYFTVEAN